jgi:Domain of unknown function (DUF4136)
MNSFSRMTILLGAIFLVQSCGPTLTITSDYDHNVTFTQYKTFKLYQPDAQHQTVSALNQQRIFKAVAANLTSKGLLESNDAADLLVNIVTVIKNQQYLSANTYGSGGYYRPYAWGGGYSTTTVTVENDKQGSLIIDIVDIKANKLVWTATGNQEIDKPLNDPDTQIPTIVNKIMASYPPGMVNAK